MGEIVRRSDYPASPVSQPNGGQGALDVLAVGKLLAASGYFKDVKDQAQAVAKILAGQELGFGPIASLTGVYVQQGKICYAANLIAAAIKKSGRYNFRVRTLTDTECVIDFFEGGEKCGESRFTINDAKQAGLLDGPGGANYRRYPRNMLFARAISNGARFHCPDVFGGVSIYTPEELGAQVDEDGQVTQQVDEETGEIQESAPAPKNGSGLKEPQPGPAPVSSEAEKLARKALISDLRAALTDAGVVGSDAVSTWLNYHFPGKGRVADLSTSELAEAVKLAVDEASAPGASLEFEEEVAG